MSTIAAVPEATSLARLTDYVVSTGLWRSPEGAKYRFQLSPDVYQVTPGQNRQMAAIGLAIQEAFAGLDTIVSKASHPSLGGRKQWDQFSRLNRAGVPSIYDPLQKVRPGSLPGICKVDLMEVEDGSYRIAEIDAQNKHAMGYSTLTAGLRDLCSDQGGYQGVAYGLSRWMKSRGIDEIVLLYADRERFYRREFDILANKVADYGVRLRVMSEEDSIRLRGYNGYLIDMPHTYKTPTLLNWMAQAYAAGEIDFLIPPKPWTSSKATLAVLRNDRRDEETEAILRDHIPTQALDALRLAIPETYLVRKWLPIKSIEGFLLKESVSSGMKGVYFQDDPGFPDALRQALATKGTMILQKEVTNRAVRYRYYDAQQELAEAAHCQRITAHYMEGAIADLTVTACQDKRVHGGNSSVFMGAVLA